MPFKAGKKPSDVSKKIDLIMKKGLPRKVNKGLFAMYNTLSATANYYVPVDTSTLIKSRAQKIRRNGNKWRLTYGYYTKYAAALHSPKPSGKMNGWSPVRPGTKGKKGGGYNPNARQGWMDIAWDVSGEEALRIFKRIVSE